MRPTGARELAVRESHVEGRLLQVGHGPWHAQRIGAKGFRPYRIQGLGCRVEGSTNLWLDSGDEGFDQELESRG